MSNSPTNPHDVFCAGTLVRDRYRIVSPLGKGGMAVVFLVTDENLNGRSAVLKTPRPGTSFDASDLCARFANEIANLIGVGHVDGVVDILDQGAHEGCPFYVAQWMSGGSLQAKLGTSGHQTVTEVATWLTPVASALDAVHARRLVHRDVKPDNILFSDRNEARLADFGIARVAVSEGTGASTDPTRIGSANYWAPEQAEGRALDGRADQFSLAATVFRALTGQHPARHGGASLLELNPSVGASRARAVDRAMSHHTGDRFGSCREFAAAFAAIAPVGAGRTSVPTVRSIPTAANAPRTQESQSLRARNWPGRLLVAVLGLLVVGAGFLLFGQQESADNSYKPDAPAVADTDTGKTSTNSLTSVDVPAGEPPDTRAPVITVTFPPTNDFETTESVVTVRGRVAEEHLDVLMANGVPIAVRDGAFFSPTSVPLGSSVEVTLRARDKSGNESKALVFRLRHKNKEDPWHRHVTAFVRTAIADDLRNASTHYQKALEAGAPSSVLPAIHERAVLAWRQPPNVRIISPEPGLVVVGENPIIELHWKSGRATDRLWIQGTRVNARPSAEVLRLQAPRAIAEGASTLAFEIRDGTDVRWSKGVPITRNPVGRFSSHTLRLRSSIRADATRVSVGGTLRVVFVVRNEGDLALEKVTIAIASSEGQPKSRMVERLESGAHAEIFETFKVRDLSFRVDGSAREVRGWASSGSVLRVEDGKLAGTYETSMEVAVEPGRAEYEVGTLVKSKVIVTNVGTITLADVVLAATALGSLTDPVGFTQQLRKAIPSLLPGASDEFTVHFRWSGGSGRLSASAREKNGWAAAGAIGAMDNK